MASESGYLRVNFDANVNYVESPNGTYTYSGQNISTDGEGGSSDGIWYGTFTVNCKDGYIIDTVTSNDSNYWAEDITDYTFYGTGYYSSFNTGSPEFTITTKLATVTPTYTTERLYKASSIQESKTVTANGTVAPDDGYELLKEVVVSVPEAAVETEEKNVTITSNGSKTITPSEGKYISKVNITTNVSNIWDTGISGGVFISVNTSSIWYTWFQALNIGLTEDKPMGIFSLPCKITLTNIYEPGMSPQTWSYVKRDGSTRTLTLSYTDSIELDSSFEGAYVYYK